MTTKIPMTVDPLTADRWWKKFHVGDDGQFRRPVVAGGVVLDPALIKYNPGFEIRSGRDVVDHIKWPDTGPQIISPFGMTGDTLWIRERWALRSQFNDHSPRDLIGFRDSGRTNMIAPVLYPATDTIHQDRPAWKGARIRQPHHMPYWARRMELRVKEVRVERLDQIPVWAIKADGFEPVMVDSGGVTPWGEGIDEPDHHGPFVEWWDGQFAKSGHGWESNPVVWVVTFERSL